MEQKDLSNNQEQLNNKVNKMSFELGMRLAGLPIVTFYQGEEDLNFILDTGSDWCVIDEGVLDKIEYEDSDRKMTLMGIDGEQLITPVKKIVISYKRSDYDYEFLVRDLKDAFDNIERASKIKIHGMLGSGFFNKYSYVLDFAELIAYSKK